MVRRERQQGYDGDFLALASHLRHQLPTPRTAARPSSLRSVPSGFPTIMANTQKKAAVHTASSKPRPRNGERRCTKIRALTEYESVNASGADRYGSFSCCLRRVGEPDGDRRRLLGLVRRTRRSWTCSGGTSSWHSCVAKDVERKKGTGGQRRRGEEKTTNRRLKMVYTPAHIEKIGTEVER